jgi:hypothetical protein
LIIDKIKSRQNNFSQLEKDLCYLFVLEHFQNKKNINEVKNFIKSFFKTLNIVERDVKFRKTEGTKYNNYLSYSFIIFETVSGFENSRFKISLLKNDRLRELLFFNDFDLDSQEIIDYFKSLLKEYKVDSILNQYKYEEKVASGFYDKISKDDSNDLTEKQETVQEYLDSLFNKAVVQVHDPKKKNYNVKYLTDKEVDEIYNFLTE